MYLDALEFLDEEREAWAPFEALAALDDAALDRPIEAAHGWSGRDLAGHLLVWQQIALDAARELAVDESSPTIAKWREIWANRDADSINADFQAEFAALSLDEVRGRLERQPGELRGTLTVVPEARWVKHAEHLAFMHDYLTSHYEEHADDLRAILDAARGGPDAG